MQSSIVEYKSKTGFKVFLFLGVIISLLSSYFTYLEQSNEFIIPLIGGFSLVLIFLQSCRIKISVSDDGISLTGIKLFKNDLTFNWNDIEFIYMNSIFDKKIKTFHVLNIKSKSSNKILRYGGSWCNYEDLTRKIIERLPSTCKIDENIYKYILNPEKNIKLPILVYMILGMIILFFAVMFFAKYFI